MREALFNQLKPMYVFNYIDNVSHVSMCLVLYGMFSVQSIYLFNFCFLFANLIQLLLVHME